MLISVIVPVHNSHLTLARCINSIMNQTYTQWELVLVDDGSTDDSLDICNSFALCDSRILVIHQENSGVSSARNKGIDLSSGQWVTFCDSDDEMPSNSLTSYVQNFDEATDIIRGGFVREKNGINSRISAPIFFSNDKGEIIRQCTESKYEAYIWNSCFRKSAIKNIRFREDISWCEDHLFTFSVIEQSRYVKFISDIVYHYYAPTIGESFGSNLSTRYIAPLMIMEEALTEKSVKLKCLAGNSFDVEDIISREFQFKIHIAMRYAISGNKYWTALSISNQYLKNWHKTLISMFFHIKITPALRKILSIFFKQ